MFGNEGYTESRSNLINLLPEILQKATQLIAIFIRFDQPLYEDYLNCTELATKPRRLTLKCRNTPLLGAETKMDKSILIPVKSSYIFW